MHYVHQQLRNIPTVSCDRIEALNSGMLRSISAENDIGVSVSDKMGRSKERLVE